MNTERRAVSKTLVFVGLSVSLLIVLAFAPRYELGNSVVHHMTHWISFSQVSTPVTVRMLISAESRPYLELLDTNYSPTPVDISEVQFHFHPGDAGQKALQITWIISSPTTVYADFEIATYETHYVAPLIRFETSEHEEVASTPFYPVGDSAVQRVAKEVSRRVQGWWSSNTEKARAVYDWLRENIQYDTRMLGVYDPVEVLSERRAVCEGFAYTFATLSRALGVPARVFYGNVALTSEEYSLGGIFWQKHAWAEFWDGFNWQPADPTLGNFSSLSTKPCVHTSFGLWDIEVRSEKGMVWPLNRDRRVAISGCGLDWTKFVRYGTTPWVFLWMVTNGWVAGMSLAVMGSVYLGRISMRSTYKSGAFTQRQTSFSQNSEDTYCASFDIHRHDRRTYALPLNNTTCLSTLKHTPSYGDSLALNFREERR